MSSIYSQEKWILMKRNFRSQFLQFQYRLSRFFGFWLFIIVACVAVVVAALDHLSSIQFFKDKTPLVIASLLAVTLGYIVVERAKVLEEIISLLQTSRV